MARTQITGRDIANDTVTGDDIDESTLILPRRNSLLLNRKGKMNNAWLRMGEVDSNISPWIPPHNCILEKVMVTSRYGSNYSDTVIRVTARTKELDDYGSVNLGSPVAWVVDNTGANLIQKGQGGRHFVYDAIPDNAIMHGNKCYGFQIERVQGNQELKDVVVQIFFREI